MDAPFRRCGKSTVDAESDDPIGCSTCNDRRQRILEAFSRSLKRTPRAGTGFSGNRITGPAGIDQFTLVTDPYCQGTGLVLAMISTVLLLVIGPLLWIRGSTPGPSLHLRLVFPIDWCASWRLA